MLDFLKYVFDDDASIWDQTPERKVVQTLKCNTKYFRKYESDNTYGMVT